MIESLDKRICDFEKGATNKQTLREFIVESEKEFGLKPYPLDETDLIDDELEEYVEFLCELWDK